MRVPGAYATAVRNAEGDIKIDRHEFISIIDIYPLLKIPILRGIVGLFEALNIGYSSLQWSSEMIVSNAIIKGNRDKLLKYAKEKRG